LRLPIGEAEAALLDAASSRGSAFALTPEGGLALYLNALGLETESACVAYKTTVEAAACRPSPILGRDAALKIAMIARQLQPLRTRWLRRRGCAQSLCCRASFF